MANAAEGGAGRPSLFARLGQEHTRVFFFSLGKLWQNPIGTLLTTLVIGVTLALPASLNVLLKNASAVSHSWQGTLQASLFLKDSTSPDLGRALATDIARRTTTVASAEYISREQSLADFREYSGYGEALDTLDSNPLPAVIVVTPRQELNRPQINQLMDELGKLPEVELAKLDQKWLERLYAVLQIIGRAISLIAGILALAVIVIVGNTIRLDIENRREEIVVMKLIGAPNAFVRRPFLYTGLWYGFMGALIGVIIVEAMLVSLAGPGRTLADLYQSGFTLSGLSLAEVGLMFGGGIFLGWAGAFWTVTRHLGKIEPS